jgi:glycosyltransferase involved in cell wall biosynthesis
VKASIIIRAFNSAATLERAIKSAIAQSLPNSSFEVIVVDDGSSDGTSEIVQRMTSPNLVFVKQQHRGGGRAANKGVEIAKGEYLTLLDSDDEFFPYTLATLVAALESHTESSFAFGNYLERSGNIEVTVRPAHAFHSTAVGTLYRTNLLKTEGFYSEGVSFPEYDLLLRNWGKWKGLCIQGPPLFIYNRRQDSATANRDFVKRGLDQLRELYPSSLALVNSIRSY